MAATWTIKVTRRDSYRATVTGMRTDGEKVETVTIETKLSPDAKTDVARLASAIEATYKDMVAKTAARDAELGKLEADMAVALNTLATKETI